MSELEVRRAAVVKIAQGLHARPAIQIGEAAMGCKSSVQIVFNDLAIDAKSVLQVLTLLAPYGSPLTVIACGEDAQQAVDAICEIIETDHDAAMVAPPKSSNS